MTRIYFILGVIILNIHGLYVHAKTLLVLGDSLSAAYQMKNFEFTIFVNNLFNKQYFENTFVPMPKGNVLFGLKFYFK